MADDPSQPPTTRRPRLGVLVRLAIYVPLLGFFGFRAWQRFSLEREASDEVFRERVGLWLERPPATIMLPSGEALPMLTPEQAKAQGFELPPSVTDPPPPPEGTLPPEATPVGPEGSLPTPPVTPPADGALPIEGTPPAGGPVQPVQPTPGPTPGPTPAQPAPGPTPAQPKPAPVVPPLPPPP